MVSKLSLTSVQIFQFLTPPQVKLLVSHGKSVEKHARDVVLLAGESVPGIYVIGEGAVGVYPGGSLQPIARLTVSQSFGEMSFIESGKASATIRAEEPGAKLMLVLHTDLTAMIADDPTFGLALYRGMSLALSQKLRTTTAKITAEIKAGRQLLDQLSADESGVSFDINVLPSDLAKQNQQVLATLEDVVQLSEDLFTKCPGEGVTIARLQSRIGDVKHQYIKFYPRLARQMQTITNFIVNIEKSLLQANGD